MTIPANFISTSDFPTFKNDNNGVTSTVTLTMPGSQSVPGNGSVEYTADVVQGAAGAICSAMIYTTKSLVQNAAQTLILTRIGVTSGSPAPYSVAFYIRRLNTTTIRCEAVIQNPYSTTLTGEAGDETATFTIRTFVPPFA